jgi:photosystem II stability/assembly factor-like uncharacterized protein
MGVDKQGPGSRARAGFKQNWAILMRREFLKCVLGGLAVAGAGRLGISSAATLDGAQRFAALADPAVLSSKAASAAFLASARAGHRIVCVGERGIVIYSDDEGTSWHQANVPVSTTLTAVQFVDARSGWAVGHLGVVLHSSDGGANWTKQLDGVRVAQLALAFANTPAAATDADARERALKHARALVSDGPDKPFFDVQFDNASDGLIVGAYNLAFKTGDGGSTWTPWMGHMQNPKDLHVYALRRHAGETYAVGEQGLLLRRSQGSEDFVALKAPYSGTFFGMVVTKSGALIAFGLRGKAFLSDDNAETWREVPTGVSSSLSSGTVLVDGRIVLAGQAGDMTVSTDGGRSFHRQAVPEPIPITSLLEIPGRSLIATDLRGVRWLAPN